MSKDVIWVPGRYRFSRFSQPERVTVRSGHVFSSTSTSAIQSVRFRELSSLGSISEVMAVRSVPEAFNSVIPGIRVRPSRLLTGNPDRSRGPEYAKTSR